MRGGSTIPRCRIGWHSQRQRHFQIAKVSLRQQRPGLLKPDSDEDPLWRCINYRTSAERDLSRTCHTCLHLMILWCCSPLPSDHTIMRITHHHSAHSHWVHLSQGCPCILTGQVWFFCTSERYSCSCSALSSCTRRPAAQTPQSAALWADLLIVSAMLHG